MILICHRTRLQHSLLGWRTPTALCTSSFSVGILIICCHFHRLVIVAVVVIAAVAVIVAAAAIVVVFLILVLLLSAPVCLPQVRP